MYLLFCLAYLFSRCLIGQEAVLEWVWSRISRTRIADVNRLITLFNILVVKSLLVLRLRAIWNKNLIGERAGNIWQWTRYTDFCWILVTLILSSIMAGMFCRIWSLINRDDWRSKLAELLVGLKDSTILNLPADHIFSDCDICGDSWHIYRIIFRTVIPSPWLLDGPNTFCQYILHSWLCRIVRIWLCKPRRFFSHKKVLPGWQQQWSKSSWPLSGLPWHSKHRAFLVMEYAVAFLTCKPRLVYYMYFTAMEPCYLYRESKTRYHWSDWWPIDPVS